MRSPRFLDNLNDAVRDNPVAAGLIGLGLAWMVLGKSTSVMRKTSAAASAAADTVEATTEAVADGVAPVVTGAADHLRKAASGLGETVAGGVQNAASRIRRAVTPGTEDGGPPPLARGFVDLVERQPLALGAVGLAVGAAIASAFPSTEAEGRVIGPAGGKFRDTVADAGDILADRVGSAVGAAADEAEKQGLTPSALKETMAEGATKLRAAADAARAAVEK
jgi:hypothetical protein